MKRIVIKIGTGVLSTNTGTLDLEFLENMTKQIVELRGREIQVILITSGAVGAGKSLLSLKDIKSEVVKKQVFAAIGQVKLMTAYSEFFSKHNYYCAQVLATKEDFRDEEHYLNMQNCFEGLMLDNVIPIVNENDVVATTELLFTDNDELAGLVAEQLKVDGLIILTSTDGILDNKGESVLEVDSSNAKVVMSYIKSDKSTFGKGGMISKFNIARRLSKKGITVYIVDGKESNVLLKVINGQKIGTKFMPEILYL
jgi:glutamate 5-kinase